MYGSVVSVDELFQSPDALLISGEIFQNFIGGVRCTCCNETNTAV